jgi:hypothetical protein
VERRIAVPLAPPPRSRFGRGLLLALALFAAALGVYRYSFELAARLPAIAPALEAYAGAVDRLREAMAPERPGG